MDRAGPTIYRRHLLGDRRARGARESGEDAASNTVYVGTSGDDVTKLASAGSTNEPPRPTVIRSPSRTAVLGLVRRAAAGKRQPRCAGPACPCHGSRSAPVRSINHPNGGKAGDRPAAGLRRKRSASSVGGRRAILSAPETNEADNDAGCPNWWEACSVELSIPLEWAVGANRDAGGSRGASSWSPKSGVNHGGVEDPHA